MVDNRSLGPLGAPSNINFKGSDISGTAAKTSDDKMGQGTEYFATYPEEEFYEPEMRFMDRSAQLHATLNSLAMMNVANILKTTKELKQLKAKEKQEEKEKIVEEEIEATGNDEPENNDSKNDDNNSHSEKYDDNDTEQDEQGIYLD